MDLYWEGGLLRKKANSKNREKISELRLRHGFLAGREDFCVLQLISVARFFLTIHGTLFFFNEREEKVGQETEVRGRKVVEIAEWEKSKMRGWAIRLSIHL